MTVEELTGVSSAKLISHHTLHHTLNIPRVRVPCTVVYGRFIDYIVRCVTCLVNGFIRSWLFSSSSQVAERERERAEGKRTWRTLRARRISPRDNLRSASRPSSVRFTLQSQVKPASISFPLQFFSKTLLYR